jgi:hypothetical protein
MIQDSMFPGAWHQTGVAMMIVLVWLAKGVKAPERWRKLAEAVSAETRRQIMMGMMRGDGNGTGLDD